MKRQSNILTLVLCMALLGCGSGSYANGGGSPTPTPTPNATMQAGQWEFVLTPSSGNPIYLEPNLSITNGYNGSVSSSVFNTAVFAFGGGVGGLFTDTVNIQASGSLTNGVLSGAVAQPGGTPTFSFSSATVASNGQAVSGGSYTIPSNANIGGLLPTGSSGQFSGYKVSPLNGTFAGTITGLGLTDQITINVTQDSNFGITASGTDLSPGVSTALSISPAGTPSDNTGGYSNVIGATIQAMGAGVNASGTHIFQVFGHFNPTATQVIVVGLGQSGQETGTLTKQ